MACCVPGCTDQSAKLSTPVPSDPEIRELWKQAIEAGTDQPLPDVALENGRVCESHFANQPAGVGYREPFLFVRDQSVERVACCQLCFRYDSTERMFDRKHCLDEVENNISLQAMAYKYFRVRPFCKPHENDGFYCRKCVTELENTHRFSEQIAEGTQRFELLMRKLAHVRVEFEEETVDVVVKQEPGPIEGFEFEVVELGGVGVEDEVAVPPPPKRLKPNPTQVLPAIEIKEEVPELSEAQVESFSGLIRIKEEPIADSVRGVIDPDEINSEFSCYICNEVCASRTLQAWHLLRFHVGQQVSYCEECTKPFHQAPHLNRSERCPICITRKSDAYQVLNNYMKTSTDRCPRCGQIFHQQTLEHHIEISKCTPKPTCSGCDALLNHEDELESHVEVIHGTTNQQYRCGSCDEYLNSRILLPLHHQLLCREQEASGPAGKPDQLQLWYCAMLLFLQRESVPDTCRKLYDKYGDTIVTPELCSTWFERFSRGDFEQGGQSHEVALRQLIEQCPTASTLELSEQLVTVDQVTVLCELSRMGLTQRCGHWVPRRLILGPKIDRYQFCARMLNSHDSAFWGQMICFSERWVACGKFKKRALLCVWWDVKGLIYHEVLEADKALARHRHKEQYTRFFQAFLDCRPEGSTRALIYQCGWFTDSGAYSELKQVLDGMGWELQQPPVDSPDLDPTEYHLFRAMGEGLANRSLATVDELHRWVARFCRAIVPTFFSTGLRELGKRWDSVERRRGDYY